MAKQNLMDEKTRNVQESLKGPKTQESNPISKYTSEMDETEEAESQQQPTKEPPKDKQARQQIDQEVWRSAKPKLKSLIHNYGQNKYVSNTCTITSVFDHKKEQVNSNKGKLMKECREVISEEMIYQMNSLNVKWQKQEFTDEQSLQLRQCADELKYLNKQDLSRYQALLT